MSSQKDVPQWTSIRIDLIVLLFLLLPNGIHGGQNSSSSSFFTTNQPPSSSFSSATSSYPMKSDVLGDEVENSEPPTSSSSSSSSDIIGTTITPPPPPPTTTTTPPTTTRTTPSDDNDEPWNEYEFGQLIRVPRNLSIGSNEPFIEYEWRIPNFFKLLEVGVPFVRSPPFHLSKPGYRAQLLIWPNNTFTDGSSYLGIFFRLMTSEYDETLEWPFQLKATLTLVDLIDFQASLKHSITPNTDPCRLRSVFLRPSQQDDWTLTPDGCGTRRVISLLKLFTESSRYLRNGTLVVRGLFQLGDKGITHKTATTHLRHNNLVTKHTWNIHNFTSAFEKANTNGSVTVLQSEPFYTHQGGYLVKMFMTLLPKDRAFAISLALMQGDYDRYLQWPFPYSLEVSIVDHSPEYWRKDYTILLTPSSADCTSSPFFQPSNYLDFCFTTIQSWHLLHLTHYRFIVNDTLDIQLTTKFNHLSGRKSASIGLYQDKLVSEFTWSLPNIRYKLSRFDYMGRSLKTFTSPEFYTNGQGYLMQLSLRLNSTGPSKGDIGLETTIIEGEYDNLLNWPFNQTIQLMIINQVNEYSSNEGLIIYNRTEIVTSAREDEMMVTIVPSNSSTHECSRRSFMKPIERNPSCGKKKLISFTRINRSADDDTIKFGNLLIKARIFL